MSIATNPTFAPLQRVLLLNNNVSSALSWAGLWSAPDANASTRLADLASQEFKRFRSEYTRRLDKFLELTCGGVRANPTPRVLAHYTKNVEPRLDASSRSLRATSLADVTAMRNVADILLGIADSFAADSADSEHWLYSAGRQYVEALEAKRLCGDSRNPRATPPLEEDSPHAEPAYLEHDLAA